MTDLVLPHDLQPGDGRFGSGPSLVRAEALASLAATGTSYMGTSHRRDGVRSVVGSIRRGLADLFSLPDGYEVVLGNGGTTAFWDAALYRLITERSQHAVFGEFSGKFAAAAAGAPHLEDPAIVEADPGSRPRLEGRSDIDVHALTHNETSTGVMTPVERPTGDALVLVDATSAAGAMAVDPAAFDAYYFAPQKAFGSDAGLWVALCSPAAIDRIGRLAFDRWAPPSIDLAIAVDNSRKDQTYNTPALATLFLLADQIEWMHTRGGLEWAVHHGREAADLVYGWAESSDYATPFVVDPAMRSTTVATVDLDDAVPVDDLAATLRANGIVDIEGYRKLGRNQIRIAMFPNVAIDDLERLTKAIDWIVEHR